MGVPISCRARPQHCWLYKNHIFKARIYNKDRPTSDLITVSIDLNEHIGVDCDMFDLTNKHFTKRTRRIYLEGFVLHGEIDYTNSDGVTISSKRSIDLNLLLGVCGNELHAHKPSTNICDSGSLFYLEDGTTVYQAFCLNSHGMLQYSFIDLDEHLGNKDGKFITGSKHFWRSAQDIHLDESGVVLCAKLQNYKKEWVDATFDLSTSFANVRGYLSYKQPDKGLDRNSRLTQFLESVPYLGWVAVAGHLRANNPDHAKRAMARTVYATIVFAAGATGAVFGGPLGIAIGATVGTVIGVTAEGLIRLTVSDETVEKDLDEITLKRIVKEVTVNVTSGLVGDQLGKAASRATMNAFATKIQDELMRKVKAKLAEEGVSAVGGHIFSTAFTEVQQALKEYSESSSSK